MSCFIAGKYVCINSSSMHIYIKSIQLYINILEFVVTIYSSCNIHLKKKKRFIDVLCKDPTTSRSSIR